MTKSRTKGEARRAKKARAANGQFAAIPDAPRDTRGALARPTAGAVRALVVRARLAGIEVPEPDGKPQLTPELFRRLRQPWMGCNAGRAIEGEEPSDRAELWGAIVHVRRAYERYWRIMGIPAPYPPAARMLYAPDPGEQGVEIEEVATLPGEPMTLEDAVKSATAAMMRCEAVLGHVRWAKACLLYDHPVREKDGLLRVLRDVSSCASPPPRAKSPE